MSQRKLSELPHCNPIGAPTPRPSFHVKIPNTDWYLGHKNGVLSWTKKKDAIKLRTESVPLGSGFQNLLLPTGRFLGVKSEANRWGPSVDRVEMTIDPEMWEGKYRYELKWRKDLISHIALWDNKHSTERALQHSPDHRSTEEWPLGNKVLLGTYYADVCQVTSEIVPEALVETLNTQNQKSFKLRIPYTNLYAGLNLNTDVYAEVPIVLKWTSEENAAFFKLGKATGKLRWYNKSVEYNTLMVQYNLYGSKKWQYLTQAQDHVSIRPFDNDQSFDPNDTPIEVQDIHVEGGQTSFIGIQNGRDTDFVRALGPWFLNMAVNNGNLEIKKPHLIDEKASRIQERMKLNVIIAETINSERPRMFKLKTPTGLYVGFDSLTGDLRWTSEKNSSVFKPVKVTVGGRTLNTLVAHCTWQGTKKWRFLTTPNPRSDSEIRPVLNVDVSPTPPSLLTETLLEFQDILVEDGHTASIGIILPSSHNPGYLNMIARDKSPVYIRWPNKYHWRDNKTHAEKRLKLQVIIEPFIQNLYPGEWSDCKDKIQTRQIKCMKENAQGTELYHDPCTIPDEQQHCEMPAQWSVGPWSGCGPHVTYETRTVNCAAWPCSGSQPSTRQECGKATELATSEYNEVYAFTDQGLAFGFKWHACNDPVRGTNGYFLPMTRGTYEYESDTNATWAQTKIQVYGNRVYIGTLSPFTFEKVTGVNERSVPSNTCLQVQPQVATQAQPQVATPRQRRSSNVAYKMANTATVPTENTATVPTENTFNASLLLKPPYLYVVIGAVVVILVICMALISGKKKSKNAKATPATT